MSTPAVAERVRRACLIFARQCQRWPLFTDLEDLVQDVHVTDLTLAINDLKASGALVREDGRYRPRDARLIVHTDGGRCPPVTSDPD